LEALVERFCLMPISLGLSWILMTTEGSMSAGSAGLIGLRRWWGVAVVDSESVDEKTENLRVKQCYCHLVFI
jgi:hypothetical protein